jgi:hypothetical protein
LIARTNHRANFVDSSAQNFFDDDGEGRFLCAVTIDERLQREGSLIFTGSGNDGFSYFHGIELGIVHNCRWRVNARGIGRQLIARRRRAAIDAPAVMRKRIATPPDLSES